MESLPGCRAAVDFLVSQGLPLTALEMYSELVGCHGTQVSELKAFVEQSCGVSVSSKHGATASLGSATGGGMGAADTQRYQQELRVREEKIVKLEYELRLAKEDIEEAVNKCNAAEEQLSAMSGGGNANDVPAPDISDDEAMDMEKRRLNSMIATYMMAQGYRLSSVTFSDEAGSEMTGGTEKLSLLALLRFFGQNIHTDKEQEAEIQVVVLQGEVRKLEAQLQRTQAELAAQRKAWRSEVEQLRASSVSETTHPGKSEPSNINGSVEGEEPMEVEVPPGSTFDPNVQSQNESDDGDTMQNPTEKKELEKEKLAVRDDSFDQDLDRLRGELGRVQTRFEQVIDTVSDALPSILPNVLLAKRDTVLPVVCCMIQEHPSGVARERLGSLLFNAVKRPDSEQRRSIIASFATLAGKVGSERTVEELLPHCWEQLTHKYPERRVLVADACGKLGDAVGQEMRGSLLLSMLEQLLDDKAALVRRAVCDNLILLVEGVQDRDKLSKFMDITLRLMKDSSAEVVQAAQSTVLPAIADWAAACGAVPLIRGVIAPLFSQAGSIMSRSIKSAADKGSNSDVVDDDDLESSTGRLVWDDNWIVVGFGGRKGSPFALDEEDESRLSATLSIAASLLGKVKAACLLGGPFASWVADNAEDGSKPVPSAADLSVLIEQAGDWASLKEAPALLGNQDASDPPLASDWEALETVQLELMPAILRLLCRLHPHNFTLWGRAVDALHQASELMGSKVRDRYLAPIVSMAAGRPASMLDGKPMLGLGAVRGAMVAAYAAAMLPADHISDWIVEAVDKISNRQTFWSDVPEGAFTFACLLLSRRDDLRSDVVDAIDTLVEQRNIKWAMKVSLACLPTIGALVISKRIAPTMNIVMGLTDDELPANSLSELARVVSALAASGLGTANIVESSSNMLQDWMQPSDSSSASTEKTIHAVESLSAYLSIMRKEYRDTFFLSRLLSVCSLLAEDASVGDSQMLRLAGVVMDAFSAMFQPHTNLPIFDHSAESMSKYLVPSLKTVFPAIERHFGPDSPQAEKLQCFIRGCASVLPDSNNSSPNAKSSAPKRLLGRLSERRGSLPATLTKQGAGWATPSKLTKLPSNLAATPTSENKDRISEASDSDSSEAASEAASSMTDTTDGGATTSSSTSTSRSAHARAMRSHVASGGNAEAAPVIDSSELLVAGGGVANLDANSRKNARRGSMFGRLGSKLKIKRKGKGADNEEAVDEEGH